MKSPNHTDHPRSQPSCILNQRPASLQQRRVHHHVDDTDSYAFFNLLTGPQMLDGVDDLLPAHRERLFPPTETLSMFLAQVLSFDGSCRQAVDDAALKRIVNALPRCSASTSAYCQARKRLPMEMISALARQSGDLIADAAPQWWRWQGRRVRLVDGATVTLADTEENQARYPQPSSQKPGLGFPICRMVALLCLASGALLNAATGPCEGNGRDEQTLLRGMLDTLDEGDILLGDAFYPTFFLLAYNLIRLLMAQAALLSDQIPRQLSFKHTVQVCLSWQKRGGPTHNGVALHRLLLLIAGPRVGLRPGRIEPRAVKRHPKQFPPLTKPRKETRAEVRENGHPKKKR